MNFIKNNFKKIFFLFILHGLFCSTVCFSMRIDFLDTEEPQGRAILRRDVKIPIGCVDDVIHHLSLTKGTFVDEIPSKISQQREAIGLPSQIPIEQQDEFFEDLYWQTIEEIMTMASMPGKITKVFVHKGKQVKGGERLCIIEAMKMETVICSLCPGIINDLFIELGKFFNKDSILLTLLPTFPKWKNITQAQILENKEVLIPFFPWAVASPVESLVPLLESSPNREERNEPISSSATFHVIPEESVQEEALTSSLQVIQADAMISLAIQPDEIDPNSSPSPLITATLIFQMDEQESENWHTFTENKHNQCMGMSPENFLHIPLQPLEKTPVQQLVQITPEDSILEEKPSSLLSIFQPENFICLIHHEQEIELQNSFIPDTLLMNEALMLTLQIYSCSLERALSKLYAAAPNCCAELISVSQTRTYNDLESGPRLKTRSNNLVDYNKEAMEKDTYNFQLKASFAQPKAMLKEKFVNNTNSLSSNEGVRLRIRDAHVLQYALRSSPRLPTYYLKAKWYKYMNELNIFPSSWAKWIFGVLILAKLIMLIKMIKNCRFIYLNLRILCAYELNNYKFIVKKIANNMNQRSWPQGQSLKLHMHY